MTDIPDEAVSDDLVEAVLNVEEGIGKAPEWYRSDKRADIRTYLTAAAPIIRADERRRVAEEIRAYVAEYRATYAIPGSPYAEGFMTGLGAFSEAHLAERGGE